MTLSCSCHEYDAEWYYNPPEDFTVLSTKRSRRCRSCYDIIKTGQECLEFTRTREPKDDIEERIYGDGWDSVPLPSYFHCYKCGEMFLNLFALGFCLNPEDYVFDTLREYHEMTGWEEGGK